MEIQIKKEADLTKLERQKLRNLLTPLFSWSPEIKKQLYYSSKPKYRLLCFEDNELIGSLSIVERTILIPIHLKIAGIGNVAVKQSHQRKGYATDMLQKAHQHLAKEQFNLSLLFCAPDHMDVYNKSGYIQLLKPVTFYAKSKLQKEETSLFYPINLSLEQKKYFAENCMHIGRGTW